MPTDMAVVTLLSRLEHRRIEARIAGDLRFRREPVRVPDRRPFPRSREWPHPVEAQEHPEGLLILQELEDLGRDRLRLLLEVPCHRERTHHDRLGGHRQVRERLTEHLRRVGFLREHHALRLERHLGAVLPGDGILHESVPVLEELTDLPHLLGWHPHRRHRPEGHHLGEPLGIPLVGVPAAS